MPPKRSLLTKQIVHGQSREIVANVLQFLKNESILCRDYLHTLNNAGEEEKVYIGDVQKRCSVATGVSLRTIQNICREQREIERGERTSFSTPNRKKNRSKPKRDMKEFDKGIVRRTVHRFIVDDKCVPTVRSLTEQLSEDIGFDGSRETLRRILEDLGFTWQRTKKNRKIPIEKHDVRLKRINYLNAIKYYRDQGRPIVYVYESCIVTYRTAPKLGSDDSNGGNVIPVTKGQRLIIVHAWGDDGFIPNATLTWKTDQTTGDGNHQLNRTNYEKWFREKLIPNLQPNTVLVMDNSSNYNYQINKAPTANAKKSDILDWLRRNKIPHLENMLKPELYQLISIDKYLIPRYALDEILSSHGHTALHLPPHHPDLNPVQMIRGKLKNWVSSKTVTSKLEDVKVLFETKMAEMGAVDWLPAYERVKNIEQEYREREQIIDKEMENIITNFGEIDTDSEWDDESDNNDDDDLDSGEMEDMDVP